MESAVPQAKLRPRWVATVFCRRAVLSRAPALAGERPQSVSKNASRRRQRKSAPVCRPGTSLRLVFMRSQQRCWNEVGHAVNLDVIPAGRGVFGHIDQLLKVNETVGLRVGAAAGVLRRSNA